MWVVIELCESTISQEQSKPQLHTHKYTFRLCGHCMQRALELSSLFQFLCALHSGVTELKHIEINLFFS